MLVELKEKTNQLHLAADFRKKLKQHKNNINAWPRDPARSQATISDSVALTLLFCGGQKFQGISICKGEKIIKTCLLSVVLFYRERKWILIIFSSHLKHRWNTYLLIWAQKEGKLLMQWNTCSRPCMQSFPRVRESECIVILAKIENYFDKYLGIYLCAWFNYFKILNLCYIYLIRNWKEEKKITF